MSYPRVIPRDLFNEAKLLKCLGQVLIASKTAGEDFEIEVWHDGNQFKIEQDPSNGAIYVDNVKVTVNGHLVELYTLLNSKDPYPLFYTLGDETDYVFSDDTGKQFSDVFLAIGKE